MALGGALGRAWAPVTPRHFAWQAWHKLTSTVVSRGRRGTNSHLLSFCVAGVGQMALGGALGRAWAPVTPRRVVWQAWHKLTSTVVSRGRCGTNSHLLSFCVAGVGLMALGGALGRAWALTSTVVLRGRRGTDGIGWCAWTGLGTCDAAARCVAGVAQTHIYCRFTWQVWHQLTSTVGLRGRRGTDGIGWRAWTGLGACDAAALCVAGVAQTHIYCRFTWQAWHKLTSTLVLRGRRGTDGIGWRAWTGLGACDAAALCVAGVAQTHIYCRFTWQAWHKRTSDGIGWRAWTGLGACDAAALCVAGVAQTHIYCRFTWQAWHKLTSTLVLRGRRGTDGIGWRAWTGLGACDAAALCVAGVAQTHIYSRFAWQAWHKLTSTVVSPGRRGTNAHLMALGGALGRAWALTSTVVLRGRRGTDGIGWRAWRAWTGLGACDAAALCVAGVAQTHIYCRFTWQAWHQLTSTVVLRGRRGTDGIGWRAWTGLGACDAAARCVAGVAQTHIYCRFTWQVWHQLTSTVGLRGRRGTDGIGWRAWTGLGACDAAALCVAGVAQTHIYCRFTWQAWHKLTSTLVLRGRRGTDGIGWRAWTGLGACDAAALCVAGVAQTHIYCRFTWQAWHKRTSDGIGWRAWTGLGACDAAALCVAGVAQTHIYCRFTWQAWHKLTSTLVLRGRRGTDGIGWRAWTGLGACDAAALCVAGVAQTHIYCRFTWQAWHKRTSTVVLRGRRGTDGIGWRAWTGLGACDAAARCVGHL